MESTGNKKFERIKDTVALLSQHYDSIQIFATCRAEGDEGTCLTMAYGSGNWYARFGQIREWIVIEEENARIKARRELSEGG